MMLSGLVTYNYLSSGELVESIHTHENYAAFNLATGCTLFISGITNIFLIKKGKLTDPVHKVWQHMFELKFVIALLLTPMIYPLTSYFAEEG